MKQRPTNLKSIAVQAAVSPSTVALALSPRTALALKTGRHQAVGIWTGDLVKPVSGLIPSHVQRLGEVAGFGVIIRAGGSLSSLHLPQWPVDGLIIVFGRRHVDEFLELHPDSRLTLVDLGAFHSEMCDYIGMGLDAGVADAVSHLHVTGRRRIALLVSEASYDWNDSRRTAYLAAMRAYGLEPTFVLSGEDSQASALTAVRTWLQEGHRLDALLCLDDAMAVGTLRALNERGLRVPDGVALVGCDGVEEAEHQHPPITSIAQPFQEMCELGWRFLENRMRNPDLSPQQVALVPTLLVRGPTQKA